MKEVPCVPAEEKWKYRELLLLADPEEQAIGRYLPEGEMYALRVDGEVVCEAVVRMGDGGECELMNLATCEEAQGRGYASELVRHLMKRYAGQCRSMLVGTSEDGRGFYRHLGFEDAFIRERFFIDNYEQEIIENGRQCVDMYCLRIYLGGNENEHRIL